MHPIIRHTFIKFGKKNNNNLEIMKKKKYSPLCSFKCISSFRPYKIGFLPENGINVCTRFMNALFFFAIYFTILERIHFGVYFFLLLGRPSVHCSKLAILIFFCFVLFLFAFAFAKFLFIFLIRLIALFFWVFSAECTITYSETYTCFSKSGK